MNKPNTTVNPYIPKARNVLKSGISTIKEYQRKDTEGENSIIMSIIFIITSFKPLKKSGFAFSSSIKIRPIPRRITKSITCNMLPLSLKALKKLSGTISISG
jgi:hypothetical protein